MDDDINISRSALSGIDANKPVAILVEAEPAPKISRLGLKLGSLVAHSAYYILIGVLVELRYAITPLVNNYIFGSTFRGISRCRYYLRWR